MGVLECASGASIWRGYDYFRENKVLDIEKTDENVYKATVSGSAKTPYAVELRIDHPGNRNVTALMPMAGESYASILWLHILPFVPMKRTHFTQSRWLMRRKRKGVKRSFVKG